MSKLKTELAKSNAEAQHLASQKIEVTAFKGIWGLSVLKLDTIIKDFYMQEFNHTEGGRLSETSTTNTLGIWKSR